MALKFLLAEDSLHSSGHAICANIILHDVMSYLGLSLHVVLPKHGPKPPSLSQRLLILSPIQLQPRTSPLLDTKYQSSTAQAGLGVDKTVVLVLALTMVVELLASVDVVVGGGNVVLKLVDAVSAVFVADVDAVV